MVAQDGPQWPPLPHLPCGHGRDHLQTNWQVSGGILIKRMEIIRVERARTTHISSVSSSCVSDIPGAKNIFLFPNSQRTASLFHPNALYSSSRDPLRDLLCEVSCHFSKQSWGPLLWVPQKEAIASGWGDHVTRSILIYECFRASPPPTSTSSGFVNQVSFSPLIPTLRPICGLWSVVWGQRRVCFHEGTRLSLCKAEVRESGCGEEEIEEMWGRSLGGSVSREISGKAWMTKMERNQ